MGHSTTPAAEDDDSERSSDELDDVTDRAELRGRYEMLLQELRVSLPGVQVLSAFLLTAPFSQRFSDLDRWPRRAFGVALVSSMFSVACLLGPTLLHRVGPRTARSARLTWSIRLLVTGQVCLAVALVASMWAVVDFVFGDALAAVMTAGLVAIFVVVWLLIPISLRRSTPRR